MAQPLFTNNAATTLASGITNVATTLTVASGTGALFPSPTGSNYSYVTLINAAGSVLEIVKLTSRSTDTLTITRAQEGTTASAFSTGDKVELRVTAAGMTDTFNNGGVQSATAVAGTGISIGSVTTTGAATHTINNTGVTSVTVSPGTGMSGGGTVTTTGTVTLTNAGVTSVTAGTGISVSASTGGVTITNTASGTVTSVATGNGLSGGTITGSGTLVVACPTFNSIGSYSAVGCSTQPTSTFSSGSNYSAGSGTNQLQSAAYFSNGGCSQAFNLSNNLSGTWKWMAGGASVYNFNYLFATACRVS
jgi:hypothetical protein